ncbi:hypothetical protein [Myxococcus qinghaiensis]|uniref:hypothetical protein n=1 Tax=Myxococcus qinghaiensis TaxID=2906758 RepID=UPI002B1FDB2C|nr:hypothetical protein [Myxococcus qinghaiensis]
MLIAPHRWPDPPFPVFTTPPLALFVFKVCKGLFLYRRAVGVTFKDALAGLALSHTVAKAVLYGVFNSDLPFFRTPKNSDRHRLRVALSEAREELFIMLLLWGAAGGIYRVYGLPDLDMRFWVTLLLVQSLPYLASVIMALLSSMGRKQQVREVALPAVLSE